MSKKIWRGGFFFVAAFLILGGFFVGSNALASTSGPNAGSDFSKNSSSWSNTPRMAALDGSAAQVSVSKDGNSPYIYAQGFGFSIPVGATINGIEVNITRKSSQPNDIKDFAVKLLKNDIVAGNDLSKSSYWSNNFTTEVYGGATSLWGSSWAVADINNSKFGIAVAAQNTNNGSSRTAYIDFISITVYYTTADTTLPTVSIDLAPGIYYWHGVINIPASASDSDSGVQKVEFYNASVETLIGKDTTAPYSIDWDTTKVDDGSHDIWAVAYDYSDNQASSDHLTVTVDNTKPATTASANGGSYNWGDTVNYDVAVVLSCNDGPGSGCANTYYSVDGGDTFIVYDGPVIVSKEGSTLFKWYSTDNAGNREDSKSQYVIIDKTAPAISFADNVEAGPVMTDNIAINYGDASIEKYGFVSSSTECTTAINASDWPTYAGNFQISDVNKNGQYVCAYAEDSVGNKSVLASSNPFNIDITAPTITIHNPDSNSEQSKYLSAETNEGTLYMSKTTGTYCGSDMVFVDYSPITFLLESDNGTSVCYKAQDTAGNTDYKMSNPIAGIDTKPPVIFGTNGDGKVFATSLITINVIFDEDLQNNLEGHHPQASDFRVYNGTEYNGENGYNISGVSYSGKMITITLSDPIKSGDNPHIDILDTARLTSVVDLAGNFFNAESGYDHKVYDKISPVITVLGDNPYNLTIGSTYTDPGATATDVVDTEVAVKTSGAVDTSTAGAYTITYTATDSSDNSATATRTINVNPAQNTNGGGTSYYQISTSVGSNGYISPTGASVPSNGNQEFTITPATDYQVADVLVDGVSKGAITSYKFENVTSNHQLSATFSEAPKSPQQQTPPTETGGGNYKLGDINKDGNVDESDFAIIMSQWGQKESGLSADLNADGIVDEVDLGILMANWGL